jgi:hypothetical protein
MDVREMTVVDAIFYALEDALDHSDMEERINNYLAPGRPDDEASDDEITATIDHMKRLIHESYAPHLHDDEPSAAGGVGDEGH